MSLPAYPIKKNRSDVFIYLLIFCLMLFINPVLMAQNNSFFLQISGKLVNDKNKIVKPFQVSVLENGTEITSLQCKNGLMKLDFEYDKYYTLLIKAKSYHSSVIIVDTRIAEKKKKEKFRFDFEYKLISESDTLRKELSELPAAVITYSKDKKGFTISEKYNSYIKDLPENK